MVTQAVYRARMFPLPEVDGTGDAVEGLRSRYNSPCAYVREDAYIYPWMSASTIVFSIKHKR